MAVDGEEAVSKAHSDEPDLILMDLSLPKTSGWEATRRLKAAVETRQIPIIAVTASAMDSDRNRALEIGCDGFSVKPPDFEFLQGMIEDLLQRASPPNS